jgi:hypothetical protein
MFTRKELNVMQQALRQWKGPWSEDQESYLTMAEVSRRDEMLECAERLAERFETILHERNEWDEAYHHACSGEPK